MVSYFHPRPVLLQFGFALLSAAFVVLPLPVTAVQDREEAEAARNSPPRDAAEVPRKDSPAARGANGAKSAAASAAQPPTPSGSASVTTITAQKRLLLDSQGREATFWGDVKVVDSRFSMACEKLTILFRDNTSGAKAVEGRDAKEGKGGREPAGGHGVGALEKAIAEGDVIIFQEKTNEKGEVERSVGRSQKAVYDTKTGNIALSGWPQVEQKQNTIVAMEEGTVILLNQKGTLEVLGHSKSVLRSTGSENGR